MVSFSNLSNWFYRSTAIEKASATETIPCPKGAVYYFGPQAYSQHKLGKILESSIPPIPPAFIESLSLPSPFPIDLNKTVGESHLLIYVPGKFDATSDLPALQSINEDSFSIDFKSYFTDYANTLNFTAKWFLVPLHAQPDYDKNPNPELNHPGPAGSKLQYYSDGNYCPPLIYLALKVLELKDTDIKFEFVTSTWNSANCLWSLQEPT